MRLRETRRTDKTRRDAHVSSWVPGTYLADTSGDTEAQTVSPVWEWWLTHKHRDPFREDGVTNALFRRSTDRTHLTTTTFLHLAPPSLKLVEQVTIRVLRHVMDRVLLETILELSQLFTWGAFTVVVEVRTGCRSPSHTIKNIFTCLTKTIKKPR